MKLILLATALASLASASPIEKREIGGVLICTGANATGHCIHETVEMGKCTDLEDPFYQNAATFAPDGEDFECFPHTSKCDSICTSPTGCTFGAVDFNYEHKFNLTAIRWNTLIGHFDCRRKPEKS